MDSGWRSWRSTALLAPSTAFPMLTDVFAAALHTNGTITPMLTNAFAATRLAAAAPPPCSQICLPHSPCSTGSCVAARVCRNSNHHNPCTNGESARARKFPCRHNPCSTRAVGCVSRCQSHHTPSILSGIRARARTCFFWSCLTASRRKARGRESTLLRRRWRCFGAVNCQRSGWCGCDTRARRRGVVSRGQRTLQVVL